MRWRWPLEGVSRGVIPREGDAGAFGAARRYDVHTGVDLHCAAGQRVGAVEEGRVVGIEDFTGPAAGSPWWLPTRAVLIEGASGVVLYGEVAPREGLKEGVFVRAGEELGVVSRVLRRDKGLPTSMLHIERYACGTRASVWWRLGEGRPTGLLDPSELLRESE